MSDFDFFVELRRRYGRAYNDGEGFGYTGAGHWENAARWQASARGVALAWDRWGPADGAFAPAPRVLDLGCGRGSLVRELRALGARAFGVDWGDDRMEPACAQGSALSLPLRARSVDLLLALDLIEHVPADAQWLLWKEVRHVAPCLILATVPTEPPHREMPSDAGFLNHYLSLPADEWARLFEMQGWKVRAFGPQLEVLGAPFNHGAANYPFALEPAR